MKWDRFKVEARSLRLYGYWRSSASWRVRWALALKNVSYEYIPVNLLKAEHKAPQHLRRNPLGAVPVLEVNGEEFLCESMAIIEWIEEVYQLSGPTLFPGTPLERAHVRALAEMINSNTSPLQTPRAQKRHSDNPEAQAAWAVTFMRQGLEAFDILSRARRGRFAFGDAVSVADLFLVPQIYNALRYKIDVAQVFPDLHAVYENACATDACRHASPEQQVDAI